MAAAADLCLIVNPTSGRGRSLRVLPAVRGVLDDAGVSYEVLVSEDPSRPPLLARAAVERGVTTVVAVGGDGLIGMVAGGLSGSNAVLGVVPSGTGDDFARALGLPRRAPSDAARVLLEGTVREIDAGVVRCDGAEARRFVNVANAGFDAAVTQRANRMRMRGGTATYVLALLGTLRAYRPVGFTVTVDDAAPEPMEAMLIAIGNGTSYGGGMRVTPGALLDDGRLQACIVGAKSTAEFVANFPRVYRGTHVHHPKVHLRHGRRFRVTADREVAVYADGEAVGSLPAEFSIEPAALRVLVPGPRP